MNKLKGLEIGMKIGIKSETTEIKNDIIEIEKRVYALEATQKKEEKMNKLTKPQNLVGAPIMHGAPIMSDSKWDLIGISKPIYKINITPEMFDFSMFGGHDEIRTTLKKEYMTKISQEILKFQDAYIFKFDIMWKYFKVDGEKLPRLYHLMTARHATDMVNNCFNPSKIELIMPYVYGSQQDKASYGENQTGELTMFRSVPYNMTYSTVMPHSDAGISSEFKLGNVSVKDHTIDWVQTISLGFDNKTTLVVYPDKSAKGRYVGKITYSSAYQNITHAKNEVVLGKVRKNDEVVYGSMCVKELKLENEMDNIKTILFVDDLLMGGATFVQGLRALKAMFGDLNDKTKVIAVPQIVPKVYHHVFPDFDKVITLDYGYSIPTKYKAKTELIDIAGIFK